MRALRSGGSGAVEALSVIRDRSSEIADRYGLQTGSNQLLEIAGLDLGQEARREEVVDHVGFGDLERLRDRNPRGQKSETVSLGPPPKRGLEMDAPDALPDGVVR